jgi:ABC-type polysaccharide/polyol phosphate export permease
MKSFLPFVAFGFIAWQFISARARRLHRVHRQRSDHPAASAPLSIYIYRTAWRHLLILAHNLLIYVLIAVAYGIWPSWQTLLVVPGPAL